MKRFLTLFLILATLLSATVLLAACQDKPVPTVDIVKDGVTQYRVIRSEMSVSGSPDAAAASKLRRAIVDATGCEIGISDDYDKDDNSEYYEILVGRTNRPETAQLPTDLANDEFVIIFTGKKILIDAGSTLAFEKAVAYFAKTYLGYDAESETYAKSNLAIPENLNLREKFEYPATVYLISPIKVIGKADRDQRNYNDIARLITSLQGRWNKQAKENNSYIYRDVDGKDEFWLEYIQQEGKLLSGYYVDTISDWEMFWRAFGEEIKKVGIVAWDPNVPSTANVAATICSVDGYLPVRYSEDKNSLYQWLIAKEVPVKMDLTNMFTGEGTIPDTDIPSSGSIKCDPYLWALEFYMDKCNSGMIAYVLDGASCTPGNYIYETFRASKGTPTPQINQLYSHDYYIYHECFFIDLTCVDDEAPCDDPDQPLGTDAATLRTILETMFDRNNGKMTKFMGFPPWYIKYTTTLNMGSRVPTTLEWEFVEVISEYNCVKEADAAHPAWMTNASVYCQYQMSQRHENNRPTEKMTYDPNVRYFTIYMGDYDSSAWMKEHIPTFFKDPGRGEYPLMWGFNPNLSDRVPMVFDYVYENMTDNDYIVTGDSGAGYVIPSLLPEYDSWVAFNAPYLSKFDMDIVGFIINGSNELTDAILKAYAKIAPVGSFHNDSSQKLIIYDSETVYMHLMNGINPENPSTPDENGVTQLEKMYGYITDTGSNFSAYRTVVRAPSDVNDCIEEFIEYANAKKDGYTYVYVDPYTLFDLVLQSGQGRHVYP